MKLASWMKAQVSKPGTASGERVAKAIANEERAKAGLPDQKCALLVDTDGTKHYHDLDLQKNGEPHREIKVGFYNNSTKPDRKVYAYTEEFDEFIMYKEV